MNADLSVAPEIAQLAAPFVAPPQPHDQPGAAPRTDGRQAGLLRELAASPQRWWDLVRFDPDAPVRVPVPGTAGAWLLVLPPGALTDCDCGYATLLGGEVAEAGRPLRAGRVRVHGGGGRHRMLGAGHGYSVSLHHPTAYAAVTPGE